MNEDALRASIDRISAAPDAGSEEARAAIGALLDALEAGTVRAAEPKGSGWVVNAWVKRGLLLAFRHGSPVRVSLPPFHFCDRDTLPTQDPTRFGRNVRLVPGGSTVRRGAFLGDGVIVMPPAYVNVGAYVGAATMIDSHALVGSCAQIGARVHLSAAVQVGGVLEPPGAMPVVVEDDAFVGGGCGLYEGVRVGRGAVLAPAVVLTRAVPLFDAVHERTITPGEGGVLMVPERAVVVPGSRPAASAWARAQGLNLYAPVIVKYRDAATDAAAALEGGAPLIKAARRMDGIDRTLIRRIFDAAPAGSINLGLGQPDLPTPERIANAGIEGIRQGKTGYTSTAGDPALRAAIASRYEGFATGAASVAVTIGSQEAVFASAMTLVDPGDEVLVPDPGYPAYPVVATLLGASPRSYPLRPERAFRLDPADVVNRLTPRTKLVILCSPSNPTGAMDDEGDLRSLAASLASRGIPWLSDEIYSGFAYDRRAPSISRFAPSGGLVVSGLSKDLSMTGWRIGWVVGPEAIVARITAAHQYIVTCASSVSQAAGLAALGDAARGDREAYLEIFRKRRALMADELRKIPALPVTMPDGAFYFFLDVRAFGSSLAIAERLLRNRRVIVIPGEAFGPGGAGFLRVSYAANDDDIRTGVRALGEVLAG